MDARETYIRGLNTPGSHVDNQRRWERSGGVGSYPILRNPTQGGFRPMMDEKGRTFELYNSRGVVDPYPDKRKTMFDPSMLQAMNLQPNQSGIMLALANNPTMNRIQNIYNKVNPFIPNIDIDDREIGYDYEKDLGPGTFNIGGDYDFDDNQYGLNIGYKMTFDDGGIATLPTPEGMQRERVPLTDEQKDFLYDYMIDFMIKQKQREQREMKGRIPPFNYEGLEV